MTHTARTLLLLLVCLLSAAVASAKSAEVTASRDVDAVVLTVTIRPGLHAQSHKPLDENLIPMVAKPSPAEGVTWGEPVYPDPKIEDFPTLGKVSVYTDQIKIRIPVKAPANAPLSGQLRLQACNDRSCYQPEKLPWSIAGTAATTAPATAPAQEPILPEAASTPTLLGFSLTHNAYPLAFTGAFLVGILFNLMPCVLPVVPLKIMGFYEASQHHRGKSLALGAVFSAGLIASFAVLAVLVVALHTLDWGGLFQHSWFTITIVVVLAAMAINLFGVFTVNLPTGIYQFAPRHDTYAGNFLFGILTAALSTPCTFGMFVALLAWTAQQPAIIGVALLMNVGVGMAFPYFVLSGFPELARKFPRTGPWSELIRQLLGFLVLATAVYFAQPLFERFVSDRSFWWSIFGVVAAGAVFAMVRTFQFTEKAIVRTAWSSLAVLIILFAGMVARRFASQPYNWLAYSDETLTRSLATGKPVLVDFTASWCGNCHFIEGYVLNNPRVIAKLHHDQVTMIKADVTNGDAPGSKLLEHFSPSGAIPLTVVYRDGIAKPIRLDGIYSADDLHRAIGG